MNGELWERLKQVIGERTLPYTVRMTFSKRGMRVFVDLEFVEPLSVSQVKIFRKPNRGDLVGMDVLTWDEFQTKQDCVFEVLESKGLIYRGFECL